MSDFRNRILTALSRITSGGRLIPEIDGLRCIAISSVVMYHLLGYVLVKSHVPLTEGRMTSWLGLALNRGWFGVQLFFVISGFVISLPFALQHIGGQGAVSLKKYYLRRVTRLEPPYILCVTLFFALLVLVKGESFHGLFPHYLSTLTYSHNILYGAPSTITAAAWSLEIEIQFYLMAPLIATIFVLPKHLRRAVLLGLLLSSCLVQPLLRTVPLNVFQVIQFFLAGFLLADVYVADWNGSPERTLAMDMVWIAAAALLFWLTGDRNKVWHDSIWVTLACAGVFVGCYASFRGRIINRVLSNRWIVVLGGMCYTIYLYHEYVISLIGRVAMSVHFTNALWVNYWIAALLMLPTTVAAASVLFVLFEKPFMRRDWPQQLSVKLGRVFSRRHAGAAVN